MSKRVAHLGLKNKLLKNDVINKAYRDSCEELEFLEKMLTARKKAIYSV